MTQPANCRQSERGFTLVELAIVMIIIGLLIGGILKGQELITNARVTSTINQAKAIDGAISTFVDQYASMPGDMPGTPNTRIPNCTAALCAAAGNGNGRVGLTAAETDPTLGILATGEASRAFVQLAAAGVMSGVDPSLAAYGPGAVPDTALGTGKLVLGYSNGTAANLRLANTVAGHYVATNLDFDDAFGAGVMIPKNAANIDRKMDDGLPNVGTVRAGGTANCSAAAATSAYLEANNGTECALLIRVQQ